MRRKTRLYLGLAGVAVVAVAAGWWFLGDSVAAASQRWGLVLPDRVFVTSLALGIAGGAIATAAWHYFSTRHTLWAVHKRLQRLEESNDNLRQVLRAMVDKEEEEVPSPSPQASPARQPVPPASPAPRRETQPAAYAPPAPRASPATGEITARYRKAASGHLSRTAFRTFFESVGDASPVDLIAPDRIAVSTNTESFLTAVNSGEEVLVFPSYDFIANQETQFNTIASVPESVAALFTLTRGDGDIVVEAPALFNNAGACLAKGEIRGFGG